MCLTPANQASPWLLFEAGALTKHMEGRACGLLLGDLGAADVSGPLAQFQHRQFNEKDCLALVKDINSKANSPLDDAQLVMIFDKWWPDLENAYQANLKSVSEAVAVPRRDDRDILEEILLRMRALESPGDRPSAGTVPIHSSASLLGNLFDSAAKPLVHSQRDLLHKIAKGKREGDAQQVERAIEDAEEGDLDTLVRAGFVRKLNDGQVRMHKIVGTYFAEKTQTDAS